MSTNKNRVRMILNRKTLEDYIEKFRPNRIFNYNETNLIDDPREKHIICRRGTKYVEHFCSHGKLSTSVMFCGNADGSVVFATICSVSWKVNGPTGIVRKVDGLILLQLRIAIIRSGTGTCALIGDNLVSHLSLKVVQLCTEYNIKFICLPPNATVIYQPLDVAVYRRLQGYWCTVLRNLKDSTEGRSCPTLAKEKFSVLLNHPLDLLKPTIQKNLISGFRMCGIHLTSVTPLLEKLPEEKSCVDPAVVGNVFMQRLANKRDSFTGINRAPIRKMMNLPAGKGITPDDMPNQKAEESIDDTGVPSSSFGTPSNPAKRKKIPLKRKGKSPDVTDSSSESSDDDYDVHSNGKTLSEEEESSTSELQHSNGSGTSSDACCHVNDVLVYHDGDGCRYPGIERTGKGNWLWPEVMDELVKIPPPLLSKQGF